MKFPVNALSATESEIILDGFIGDDWFDPSPNTSDNFRRALNSIPKDQQVTVGINSEGGSIQAGLGIFNAIRERGNVIARIDGYALSIASVIPQAATRVISPKSAVWMIHRAWSGTVGNAADMLKASEMLGKHDDTIAGILFDGTRRRREDSTLEQVQAAIAAETWFTGDEAVEWGLADEENDKPANLAGLARSYLRTPKTILNFSGLAIPGQIARFGLMAAAGGGAAPPPRNQNTMDTTKKTPTAEDATPQSGTTDKQIGEMVANLQRDVADWKAKTEAAETAAKAERERRITREVTEIAENRGIDVAAWTKRAIADETVLDDIRNLPPRGAPPLTRTPIDGGSEISMRHVKTLKTPKARFDFMKRNWNGLRDEEDRSARGVFNANTGTSSSALTTAFLADGVTTVLQNRLASLDAYTRRFSTDGMKPLALVEVKKVTAGGTAQSNPTSFEDTTNFVGTITNTEITPAHLVAGGHVTQVERNSGFALADWVEIKGHELADKVQAAINATITVGNFTATPLVSAAAAFGITDLNTLWGTIKKAGRKCAILDGEYYAKLLPVSLESLDVQRGIPGWDTVALNTYWTGATANTVGFVCDPQAIAVAGGFPILSQSAPRSGLQTTIITLDTGLMIAVNEWFSLSTRTDWVTYDVVFGAKAHDTTAGVLIKSA